MKNSLVYIGIALLSLGNVCNAFNGLVEKQRESNSTVLEAIDSVRTNKIEKTTDELFAEDNAITENNISNETQALDFEIINRNSIADEEIESVKSNKKEKLPKNSLLKTMQSLKTIFQTRLRLWILK